MNNVYGKNYKTTAENRRASVPIRSNKIDSKQVNQKTNKIVVENEETGASLLAANQQLVDNGESESSRSLRPPQNVVTAEYLQKRDRLLKKCEKRIWSRIRQLEKENIDIKARLREQCKRIEKLEHYKASFNQKKAVRQPQSMTPVYSMPPPMPSSYSMPPPMPSSYPMPSPYSMRQYYSYYP